MSRKSNDPRVIELIEKFRSEYRQGLVKGDSRTSPPNRMPVPSLPSFELYIEAYDEAENRVRAERIFFEKMDKAGYSEKWARQVWKRAEAYSDPNSRHRVK